MTDNEHCTDIMERVQVGDQIEIRGHVFDVGVRSEGLVAEADVRTETVPGHRETITLAFCPGCSL